MKLTNTQIANFLMSGIHERDLPLQLSWAISLNAKALATAMEAFNEKQQTLLDKYAKRDESGEFVRLENGEIELENPVEYHAGIAELGKLTADVSVNTVAFESIEQIERITPNELSTIEFMVEK